MNGIHDMGGMQNMGPIQYEKDEPVFHARWEARVYALDRAMSAWRKWNIDAWRHDIETLPPADYLRMSYYEKWFTALENGLSRMASLHARSLKAARQGRARSRPRRCSRRRWRGSSTVVFGRARTRQLLRGFD